jgi:Tol biopolymer transport system component
MALKSVRLAVAVVAIGLSGCGGSASVSPGPASPPAAPLASSSSPVPTSAASLSLPVVGRLPIGRILFNRLQGNAEGEWRGTFIMGTDGAEHQVKLPIQPNGADAVWSSDGSKLLVNSYTEGTGGAVGTFDLTTGTYHVIAPKGMADGLNCSDWTPDDKTVLCGFGSGDNVRDGIYTVDVATSTAMRLTKSAFHDTVGTAGECGGGENRGVYSPDGKRIVFEQQQCGTGPDPSSDESGQLVVIAADGTSPHVIVPFGGVKTHPGGEISWSPDGKLIAFGTQDGVLSVVAPDGTGLRTLPVPATDTGGDAYGPAWSPDGRWLLVAIAGTAPSDLYAVAADGSPSIRLTKTGLTEAYTDWTASSG